MTKRHLRRWFVTMGCLAFIVPAAAAGDSQAHGTGFDFWPDRRSLPPRAERFFLPIFGEDETPGFVDLGCVAVRHAGKDWKALQFTRDKEFSLEVPAGKYLFGLLGDEWPPQTVDPVAELRATRLVAVEVDGLRFPISPGSILDLSSPEGSFALYPVFPRFQAPGVHTLRYFWRQKRPFFFVYPFDVIPVPDPAPEFEGRRVFVAELLGDTLDGDMVLTYRLTVQ